MKAKIVITTANVEDGQYKGLRRSEVWSGELDILDDKEYLLRFAIIGEGLPQPICDLPFAIGLGHYLWIPPENAPEDEGWYFEDASTDDRSERPNVHDRFNQPGDNHSLDG